jgi:precorrin-2 dehydrogenase/sirohydrochlorin ferrochelatase
MFVKLAGRRCVVVGGGEMAAARIEDVLGSGAVVHVVTPAASPKIISWMRQGRLTWRAGVFQPADLEGAYVVFAATSTAAVNEAVFREAEARGILCNAVDDPGHCHFYSASVLRRGDLQVAISTAGQSPAFARSLRTELEELIGPEYTAWVAWLGLVRARLFQRAMDPARRKRILQRVASRRPARVRA